MPAEPNRYKIALDCYQYQNSSNNFNEPPSTKGSSLCSALIATYIGVLKKMNAARILTLTNRYYLCFGYAIHRYSRIFGTYHLSYHGMVSLLFVTGLYWTCLWEHYSKQQQLHVIKYISQLLHDCIYIHLYLGIFNYIIVALEYRSLNQYSRTVCEALVKYAPYRQPTSKTKFNTTEAFVYYKSFSNTFVLVALTAYNLKLIDWSTITLTKVLLVIGLAYPHLLIANVLRFFTVHSTLINSMWRDANSRLTDVQLAHEFQTVHGFCCQQNIIGSSTTQSPTKDAIFESWWQLLLPIRRKTASNSAIVISMVESMDDSAAGVQKSFKNIFDTFEQCQKLYGKLNDCIQRQLMLLIAQHSLILFMAVHVGIKVHLVWHAILSEIDLNLIQTNFCTYVVMICNDYVCLTVSAMLCNNEVIQRKFWDLNLM